MSIEDVMITVNYGVKEIDPYKLPPLISLRGNVSDIWESLGRPRDKKERRWIAAAIIMGQPFNCKTYEI